MNESSARRIVRARSAGLCEVCGLRWAESMHHRRKTGRVWASSNLLHVCGDGTVGCHGWIEAHPNEAEQAGWWVRSYDVPADAPVLVHISWWGSRQRVLLDDLGGYTLVAEMTG